MVIINFVNLSACLRLRLLDLRGKFFHFKDIGLLIDQVLRLSFWLLARLIVWIRPAIPAVCFIFVWSTILMTIWSFVKNIRKGIANVQRLHRIPCADCSYATNSHYLKCSVQPFVAFSEDAIDCQDFESATYSQPQGQTQNHNPTRPLRVFDSQGPKVY